MKTQEIKDFFDAANPVDDGEVFVAIDGNLAVVYGISYDTSGRIIFETQPFPKARVRKKAPKKTAKKKARKK